MTKKLLVILIALFLLSGCSSVIKFEQTENFPFTKFPSEIPTKEISRLPTITMTHTQFTLEPSITPLSNKPVYLPKIKSDEEARAELINLLIMDAACSPACFLGIQPGITKWSDILPVINQFSDVFYTPNEDDRGFMKISIGAEFSEPDSFDNLYAVIAVADDIVMTVSPWLETTNNEKSLAGLLKKYGNPTNIWFIIHEANQESMPVGEIILNYADEQMWIRFDVYGQPQTESTYSICPNENSMNKDDRPPQIVLYPKTNLLFNKVFNYYDFYAYYAGFDMLNRLDEIAGNFLLDDFYNIYLDKEAKTCLDIEIPIR